MYNMDQNLINRNNPWLCIGPVELAAVGISIAVFNQVSKIAIFPLVSITTSFVAEEDTTEPLSTKEQVYEEFENANSVNKEMEVLKPLVGTLSPFPLLNFGIN